VINACETHLDRLRTHYGPASSTYQDGLHSWHRNLTALITGAHTQVSKAATSACSYAPAVASSTP
jgi:hypothetical protein